MLSIAVYDSVGYKETHPDYPKKRVHVFSTVWNFDENGNYEILRNISLNAKNESLTKNFNLERGKIYLIKSSSIKEEEFKFPSILNKCSIIERSKYKDGVYGFRIFLPGECNDLFLNFDYEKNSNKINRFLLDQFKNYNMCDFTKYMLATISEKHGLNLENTLYSLKKFDRKSYITKEISKAFKKPKKKKKVENPVIQGVLFDGNEPEAKEIKTSVPKFYDENSFVNKSFEEVQKSISKEGFSIEQINDFLDSGKPKVETEKPFIKVTTEKREEAKEVEKPKSKFRNRFSKEDTDFIRRHRHLLNAIEMGEKLNRTPKAVSDKIKNCINSGEFSKRTCVRHSSSSVSDKSKKLLLEQFKQFRQEKGLSQKEAGTLTGVDGSFISLLERGKNGITDAMYFRMKYLMKNFDEMDDVINFKITTMPAKTNDKKTEPKSGASVVQKTKIEKPKVEKPKVEKKEFKSGVWSEEEEQFLIDHYPTNSRRFCANHLNRKETAVQKKINRLGLKKTNMPKTKANVDNSVEEANKILMEANRKLEEANAILQESKKEKKSFWKRLFGRK